MIAFFRNETNQNPQCMEFFPDCSPILLLTHGELYVFVSQPYRHPTNYPSADYIITIHRFLCDDHRLQLESYTTKDARAGTFSGGARIGIERAADREFLWGGAESDNNNNYCYHHCYFEVLLNKFKQVIGSKLEDRFHSQVILISTLIIIIIPIRSGRTFCSRISCPKVVRYCLLRHACRSCRMPFYRLI